MILKRMISYYGGKWRIAKHYPPPQHDTIIEPFAGSAGYALHYPDKQVILCDLNPVLFGVWDYLTKSNSEDIMSLPLDFTHVGELQVCQEAKWLIGFWLNAACVKPKLTSSKWMRLGNNPGSFWSLRTRARIAEQVRHIKHWKVLNCSYDQLENVKATWFVDPPYSGHDGSIYPFHDIDYSALAVWCRSRVGQTIVCEQDGADWLSFIPFRLSKSMDGPKGNKQCREVVWYN